MTTPVEHTISYMPIENDDQVDCVLEDMSHLMQMVHAEGATYHGRWDAALKLAKHATAVAGYFGDLAGPDEYAGEDRFGRGDADDE